MRIRTLLLGVAGAGLFAVSAAQAQDPAYEAGLRRMLVDATNGTCSEVMADGLRAACQQQIVGMAPMLVQLGEVESLTFVRAEETPEGKVETYAVKFTSGRTMNWTIGHLKDGKFGSAGTAG